MFASTLTKLSLLLAAFSFSLPSLALKLNIPAPGPSYNALVTNGTATITWTSVSDSDPKNISFEIQNSVTLDSFEFGTNVNTSLGTYTAILDGVPGGDGFYFQAVDPQNVLSVYAVSDVFQVFGAVSPVTTGSPQFTTASQLSTVSQATTTLQSSAVSQATTTLLSSAVSQATTAPQSTVASSNATSQATASAN